MPNTRGARERKRQERFKDFDLTNKTFSQIWDDGYRRGFDDGVKYMREENKEEKRDGK